MDLQKLLHQILLRSPANLFDEFWKEAQAFYETPAHTFTEMRVRANKKVRGDIFEEFCVLYLKTMAYEVWLLDELPVEIRELLQLPKQDMGIDIICRRGGRYTAVQCKYKKPATKMQGVSWKQLSTFQALCAKTGPYEKHIVMTTGNFVRHQGAKTEKDWSICLGGLRRITKEAWVTMCGIEGTRLDGSVAKTPEELRAARLLRFAPPAPAPAPARASEADAAPSS